MGLVCSLILQQHRQLDPMINALVVVLLCLTGVETHSGHGLVITLVTGLWRPSTPQDEGAVAYAQMLLKFEELIRTQENMIIFGDEELMTFVNERREPKNTVFVLKTVAQLKSLPTSGLLSSHLSSLQLNDPDLYQQNAALPQFYSSEYATVMFSKPFLLQEALSYDVFSTDYLYWLDPDILRLQDYQRPKFFSKQYNILRKFSHYLQLPFMVRTRNASNLQFGFHNQGEDYTKAKTYAMLEWFGGKVQAVSSIANLYQILLTATLKKGDYWTHESIFTLMVHRYPKMITEINNFNPPGYYGFQINNFRERPIREQRHVRLLEGANSTLQYAQKSHRPAPIYTTTIHTQQSFYEYELLLEKTKFRTNRNQTFLSVFVLCYMVILISKCIFNRSSPNRISIPQDELSFQ